MVCLTIYRKIGAVIFATLLSCFGLRWVVGQIITFHWRIEVKHARTYTRKRGFDGQGFLRVYPHRRRPRQTHRRNAKRA